MSIAKHDDDLAGALSPTVPSVRDAADICAPTQPATPAVAGDHDAPTRRLRPVPAEVAPRGDDSDGAGRYSHVYGRSSRTPRA